jgi:hypothetical protein
MHQQSTNLLSRRAKLKKSAYMLAAVFFCIVGIVFAWFFNNSEVSIETLTMSSAGNMWSVTTSYAAETVSYDADEPVDDADTGSADIQTLSADEDVLSDDAQIMASDAKVLSDDIETLSDDADTVLYNLDTSLDGEYEYQVISGEDGFSLAVNPGQRILFKTEVSNNTSTDMCISLYLTRCSYSALLQNAVRIGVWQSDSDGTKVAKEIEVTSEMVAEETEGDDPGCCLDSVLLADNIKIPAGNEISPGTATIDWYIWIDGNEVGNECQDAWLAIGQLQMVIKE